MASVAPVAATSFFIREYRVDGVRHLSRTTVEEAVYPFLGPGRTADDVEAARVALERAYRDAGFQTVAVEVPVQDGKDGVITLQVVEAMVGRLRVRGAQYSPPSGIKAMVPSLAEGKVVNFNEVPAEIVALNQLPDRRVTPTLRAGELPGTVDVDLNVTESSPLHGSLELNNRRSANTAALRINGSVTDHNFLQRGHTLGVSFQVAPEHPADAKVLSGYYVARFPNAGGTSLMLQGTRQDSNVSTLGGAAVAGRGEILGARALLRLPGAKNFFQSLSAGFDYKHFDQNLRLGGSTLTAPVTYFPVSANYNATLVGERRETDFGLGATLHVRGLGSGPAEFDTRRYRADGSFIYLRGEFSHVTTLPNGMQLFGKAQGQLSNQPLLDSEQFSAGGLGTARGYLESEVVGDNAILGTFEVRSPPLAALLSAQINELRAHVFADAGWLSLRDALPQQRSAASLASYGFGSRFRVFGRVNGSVDVGVPLVRQGESRPHAVRITFRLWSDF